MHVRTVAASAALTLGLVACGGGEPASACEQAMADAASVGNMQDSVSDLYPAVEACGTVDEWTQAGEAAEAFDGYSLGPEELLGNVCGSGEVDGAALCDDVG